jgi:DNA helicase HerA-like ATPase
LERVERIARLVRSKGVGVYFISQNPLDVPNSVSAQLGNRVQHALRALTPQEQKAVKAAAETFRRNPKLDVARVILELKVGEALVSTLQDSGEPSIVQRTLIRPPASRIGPITDDERRKLIEKSLIYGKYEDILDRHSAHEMLQKRSQEAAVAKEANASSLGNVIFGGTGGGRRQPQGLGTMIVREMQRSAARSIATIFKNIIFKAIGLGGRR